MCYLILDKARYKTNKEYWSAIIINQPEGFTVSDILKYKNKPTQKDITTIYEVIQELGDKCSIIRIDNKFYIIHRALVTI